MYKRQGYQFFPLDLPKAQVTSLTNGSDGNVWLTYSTDPQAGGGPASNAIGVINPTTGAFASIARNSLPVSITAGADGNLWFLDSTIGGATGNINRLNPVTHAIQSYPLGILVSPYASMASDNNGNLWIANHDSQIDEFNITTHQLTQFPLSNSAYISQSITNGPDGRIWFTTAAGMFPTTGNVDVIDPVTHVITAYTSPTPQTVPTYITTGPDGNLWFNEKVAYEVLGSNVFYYNQIAKIAPATGTITEYAGGSAGPITTGPDNQIWTVGLTVPATPPYNGQTGLSQFNLTTSTQSTFPYPPAVGSLSTSSLITASNHALWYGGPTGFIAESKILPADKASIGGSVFLTATGVLNPSYLVSLSTQAVFLDLNNDGKIDPNEPVTFPDASGYYEFDGLAPQTYTIRVVPYNNNVTTAPVSGSQSITATAGQLTFASNFGVLPASILLPLTYNATPFGTTNTDLQVAEVNGLYQLILGRAPDADGGASAVTFLKQGGTVQSLAGSLLSSTEYYLLVVNNVYQTILRRAPDSAGGAASLDYLQHGGPILGLVDSLMNSAEYNALFSSDSSFVQAIYGDILGRLATPAEISNGVAAIQGGTTRSNLIAYLLTCDESNQRIVFGAYGEILARIDNDTASYDAIKNGLSPIALAIGLFGSPEFAQRANATVH